MTIRDDNTMTANVAADSENVVEGETASFSVKLDESVSTAPRVVSYVVVGTAGSTDYVAPSGTLTIPGGAASGMIEIAILTDNLVDPDETLGIVLTRATSQEREVAEPDDSAGSDD